MASTQRLERKRPHTLMEDGVHFGAVKIKSKAEQFPLWRSHYCGRACSHEPSVYPHTVQQAHSAAPKRAHSSTISATRQRTGFFMTGCSPSPLTNSSQWRQTLATPCLLSLWHRWHPGACSGIHLRMNGFTVITELTDSAARYLSSPRVFSWEIWKVCSAHMWFSVGSLFVFTGERTVPSGA